MRADKRMTVGRALTVHLVVSLGLLALAVNATSQPWIAGAVGDQVADSLVRKWLLWTLALASVAGALVVAALPEGRRGAFIVRHAALYLFVPLLLLYLRSSSGLLAGQLGAWYVALIVAVALHRRRRPSWACRSQAGPDRGSVSRPLDAERQWDRA